MGAAPRVDVPALPMTAARLAAIERNVLDLPPPEVPLIQQMPRQERVTRKRRNA